MCIFKFFHCLFFGIVNFSLSLEIFLMDFIVI